MFDLAVVVTDVCQFLIFYSDPKIVLVLVGQKKIRDERIGDRDLDFYPDEFLLGTFVVIDKIYFSNFSNFWAYFEDVFFRPPEEREIVDLCPD